MGAERELGILNAIAAALNSSPDVRRALEQTLALVAELLGLRTGWVWLLDQDTQQFYSAAVRELPPYLQEPVRMAGRRRCWCIDEFRSGELAPENVDVMECSRLRPAFLCGKSEPMTAGLRYHASIPLYFQNKPLGIMNVTSPSWRELTPEELRLLATIADQVGVAIERARLAEDATRLARAEERARLAREIHDTLAQGLTAIALNIEGAMHRLESRPDQARERLERALAMARENLEEARRSVLDLRTTTPLAGKPLAEALAALARSFTSDTGVRVQVKADRGLRLPLRVEAELYRIAQEALSNVRKHARAHAVDVELQRHRSRVWLSVRDDGIGFVPGRPSSNGTDRGFPPEPWGGAAGAQPWRGRGVPGHGLVGMRERAALVGGRLRITSRPGQGTCVTASVPLGDPAVTS